MSQGIDWYKVLVVGKNGKLNETIEVSALWSIISLDLYKLEGNTGVPHGSTLGLYYVCLI